MDLEWLVEEFKLFLSERHSKAELHAQRVSLASSFLAHPDVSRCTLRSRVKFLELKGFSSGEVEDALQRWNEREYLQYMEGRLDDDLGGGKEGNLPADVGLDASATGSDSISLLRRKSQQVNSTSPQDLWRVGATVYAYRGDCSYYAVPLLGFDYSRCEDILVAAHQLESGAYGPKQYFPPGLKGIVPDEFAPYNLVRLNVTVIAEYPGENLPKPRFREAVVVKKNALQPDGAYTVDLEWVHDSHVTKEVDFRCIRLLSHPKVVQQESERAENERVRNQGASDRQSSASNFLCLSASKTGEPPQTNKPCGHLKNFVRYPRLDTGEPPRNLRTGVAFCSHFGETLTQKDTRKNFPLYPQSQQTCSGVDYGFNIGSFTHHPDTPMFFDYNPIVSVAEQCLERDAMFVDPQFPPSFYSISGASKEVLQNVCWKRLSEVLYRPRLNVIGSKSTHMVPGAYTPAWLPNVISSLDDVAEFEDMISPGEDGWVYGAYAVRMFVDGRWGFVLVDDFVPCDITTEQPLCLMSGTPNEVYCCILEKALAKLEGSYMALIHCRPSFTVRRVWEDLTGNVAESLYHDCFPTKEAVNSNLRATVTRDRGICRVHCCCRETDARFDDYGFRQGDVWYVDGVSQFIAPTRTTQQYFYHVLRAPALGPAVHNIESLREKLYQLMSPEAIDAFPDIPDGEVSYWMTDADYFRVFDRTVLLWFHSNSQKLSIEGTFAGRLGAGSKLESVSRWLANPQYFVSFVQPTEVLIELKLLDRRIRRGAGKIQGKSLQLHVVKGLSLEQALSAEKEVVVVTSSPAMDLVDDHEAMEHPSTIIRTALPSGNYILIPTVGCCSNEGFVVKIFSISAFYAKLVN